MGKLALELSDRWIEPGEQEEVLEVKRDSFFHKCLAYCSYYTLLFVAICVFMPSKFARAAEVIERII